MNKRLEWLKAVILGSHRRYLLQHKGKGRAIHLSQLLNFAFQNHMKTIMSLVSFLKHSFIFMKGVIRPPRT
jgi:hypothetical protein